jgi:hypothetical protein
MNHSVSFGFCFGNWRYEGRWYTSRGINPAVTVDVNDMGCSFGFVVDRQRKSPETVKSGGLVGFQFQAMCLTRLGFMLPYVGSAQTRQSVRQRPVPQAVRT